MARSQLSQLFKTSMEDNTNSDDVVAVGVESLEYATLEVQEASMEADTVEADIAELTEIAEGLESIHESLGVSQENGGLDPVAAQFAHHAVGAYSERLGVESADILPALESFGGDTGRETSTQVSTESLGQTIKNIWKAIRNAIEKAIKAIRDFFAKLFNRVDALKKRIDATKKKVSEAKGDPQGKMDVPNAGQLAYKGSVEPKAIVDGIKQSNALLSKMSGVYLDQSTDSMKGLASVLAAAGEIKDKVTGLFGFGKDDVSAGERVLKKDLEGVQEISGGKAAKVEVKESNGGAVVETSFGDVENAKKVEKAEIDTPSKADLNAALDGAADLAKGIEDSKKKMDEAIKAYDDMKKAGDKASKEADKGGEEDKEATKKVSILMRFSARDMTAPVRKTISHTWSVASATVSYAERAVGNYGEKK